MRGSRPGSGRDFGNGKKVELLHPRATAVTGRFVKRGRAKTSPRTTVTERFRRRTGKKTDKKTDKRKKR
jgi:hypothetical protein